MALVFNADGSQMAGCVGDGRVIMWDARTGAQISSLDTHSALPNRGAFSSDGTRLAVMSLDTLRVWDIARKRELVAMRRPGGTGLGLCFTPDGTRLVSNHGGPDGGFEILDTVPGSVRFRERQALRDARPESTRVLEAALATAADDASIAQALRQDPALDATVRRVALNMLLARALADQQAVCTLVNHILLPLRKSGGLTENLVQVVRANTTIPDRLRERALRFAGQESRPVTLHSIARDKVLRRGPMDAYRRGLAEAQEVARLLPNVQWMFLTLGIAQFRAGEYEAALATLARSDDFRCKQQAEAAAVAPSGSPREPLGDPLDVAFIAMAQHRLGRAAEAAASMKRLRGLLALEKWATDAWRKPACDEAEQEVGRR